MATHATLGHHGWFIRPHIKPGSRHCPPPASASELQKVGGEITEPRRVSSQNTAAPSAPSGLSPAVWYLAPADSQSPSPQQLFQTFPSRAPDCVAPSLTDDLTSYMTEEMEASQLQLPAHSSSPRKHCGHPALGLRERRGGGITTRPSRTPCQQQPLLSGITNPSCNSFLLLVLTHAHSLPHCFFISLPTWGQVTWQLHFSPPTDSPPFTLSPPQGTREPPQSHVRLPNGPTSGLSPHPLQTPAEELLSHHILLRPHTDS